jgi:hypothetical protein
MVAKVKNLCTEEKPLLCICVFVYQGKDITASVEPVANIPTEIHGKILARNVVIEGIQFHRHLDHFLGESSIHTMARNVRRRLIKMGLCPVHVESILAATLL